MIDRFTIPGAAHCVARRCPSGCSADAGAYIDGLHGRRELRQFDQGRI